MKLTIEIDIIGESEDGRLNKIVRSNLQNTEGQQKISPSQIKYLIKAEKTMISALEEISVYSQD